MQQVGQRPPPGWTHKNKEKAAMSSNDQIRENYRVAMENLKKTHAELLSLAKPLPIATGFSDKWEKGWGASGAEMSCSLVDQKGMALQERTRDQQPQAMELFTVYEKWVEEVKELHKAWRPLADLPESERGDLTPPHLLRI
jgi:hypothetical protein